MANENPDLPPALDGGAAHRLGGAWTDRGAQVLALGGTGSWQAAVLCHRRAIELLGALRPADDSQADLGTAWVNLGNALLADPSAGSDEEALDAFARAIAVIDRLPVSSKPRFRHNLAAAWMSRADALARGESPAQLAEARLAYGQSLEIALGLPLDEKPAFRVLLASCRINLGCLLGRLSSTASAVGECERAVAALGPLPAAGHRLARHHAATAWINRGEFLLGLVGGAREAVDSARTAQRLIEGTGHGSPAEAKLRLRALVVIARGLESSMRGAGAAPGADALAELTDVTESGVEIALARREGAPEIFDPFVAWFFSVGSRVYGRYQPHFLSEYLAETLSRLGDGAGPELAGRLRTIAGQSSRAALDALGHDRVILAGTQEADRLLCTARDLRGAEALFNR